MRKVRTAVGDYKGVVAIISKRHEQPRRVLKQKSGFETELYFSSFAIAVGFALPPIVATWATMPKAAPMHAAPGTKRSTPTGDILA